MAALFVVFGVFSSAVSGSGVSGMGAYDMSKCGNEILEPSNGEECEVGNDTACPGKCLYNCVCDRCGNNILDANEQCDGAWDLACPDRCQINCKCPPSESRAFTSKYMQGFSYDVMINDTDYVLSVGYSFAALRSLTVRSAFPLGNVKFYVDSNITKPSNVPAPAAHVYQYYNISVQNSTQMPFFTATHEFRVPKAWFDAHYLNFRTVKLNRYRNNAWAVLPTTLGIEDETYVYYSMSAEGYGMSLFAISADNTSAIPAVINATPNLTPPAAGTPAPLLPVCGNGILETGEDFEACCADAGCFHKDETCTNNKCTFVARCGNFVCEAGETSGTCYKDCGSLVKFMPQILAVFVTLAIVCAFGIAFAAVTRGHHRHSVKKEKKLHESPDFSSEEEKVEEYIRGHMKQEFSEREIRRELLKVGWPRDFVDKMMQQSKSKM